MEYLLHSASKGATMMSYYAGESLSAARDKTLFLKRSKDLSATGSCKTWSLVRCVGTGAAAAGSRGCAAWQVSSLAWEARGGWLENLLLKFERHFQPPQQQYSMIPDAQHRVSTRAPVPMVIPTICGVVKALSFSKRTWMCVLFWGVSKRNESGWIESISCACLTNCCLEVSLKLSNKLSSTIPLLVTILSWADFFK